MPIGYLVHKVHDDVLSDIPELFPKEIEAADVFSIWLVAYANGDGFAG